MVMTIMVSGVIKLKNLPRFEENNDYKSKNNA